MQRLLKPTEVADRLSVSRAWVYDAAKVGRIPAIRIGGEDGPLRFVADDLEAWLSDASAAASRRGGGALAALARAGGRRDTELLADRARERPRDLPVARQRSGALRIEAPIAMPSPLAQRSRTVLAQVTFEDAALHAAIVSSSGSLSEAGSLSACSPNRSSRIPRNASITFSLAS
jgi:excisionase family DNA binding protein